MFLVLRSWLWRVRRGFRSGEPVVVQEALAMEVIFDWRMEDSELRLSTVASSLRSVLFLARRPFAFRSDLLEAITPAGEDCVMTSAVVGSSYSSF
ncbi:hypothetical protein TNCV_1706401 [Trichonephila clavipes]|nr:hypothetical protein TNCV_1706401 [Trichonephila clavipes]